MTRSRALRLLSVLALSAAVLAPLRAQAAPGLLVVEARYAAYTDVTLTEDQVLQGMQAAVRSRSPYVALVLEPLGNQSGPLFHFLVLRLPGVAKDPQVWAQEPRVPAGRYRVRLLSQGPATVEIPLVDGGLVVRPRHRVEVAFAGGSAAPLALGPTDALVRLRSAVPAGARAVLGWAVTGRGLGRTDVCATTAATCPEPPLPATQATAGESSGFTMFPAQRGRGRDAIVALDGVWAQAGRLSAYALAFVDRR